MQQKSKVTHLLFCALFVYFFFFYCQVLCICINIRRCQSIVFASSNLHRGIQAMSYKTLMSAMLVWVTQTHSLMQCTLSLCSWSKLTNFCKEHSSWQKGRNYNDDNQAVFGRCCYLTMLGWCCKQPGFDDACRDSCLMFPHITSHEFMLLSLAGCGEEIFILSLMSI